MEGWRWVVGLLLLLPSVGAAPADEPQVTDPEGDAKWFGADDAYDFATSPCGLAGDPGWRACDTVDDPPDAGQTPAPPVLDIVHARFTDDGEDLAVELALASLDADFSGLLGVDEDASYSVCWGVEDDTCRDSVNLDVTISNATVQLDPWYTRADALCSDVGECAINVPFDVVPGSPGFLRWRIPRVVFAPDTSMLLSPTARATYAAYGPGDPDVMYEVERDEGRAKGAMYSDLDAGTVDEAGPGTDFTLGTALRALDMARDTVTSWEDPVGDGLAHRDDMEVLAAAYLEGETTFTLSAMVARVDDVPSDHHFMAFVGTTAGPEVLAGYKAEGGVRVEYSGFCDPDCRPFPATPLRKPAVFDVVAGSPGWINVTFSRLDMGAPGRGDIMSTAYVGLIVPEQARWESNEGVRAGVVDLSYGDFLWDAPPFWFLRGDPRPLDDDEGSVLVEDETGDVRSDAESTVTGTNLDAFDITSIRAIGTAPGEFRFELGVADLSSVGRPAGYDAIFYAVGLQLDEASVMVGYYQDADRKEFLCAPDTTVLAQPKGDPNQVIWQPIQGLLTVARDRAAAATGGSTPGSIAFVVPESCLGRDSDEDLQVQALAGGAYLLRATSVGARAGIVTMDEAQSEGPVLLEAASVVVPPVPWYAQPFGVANFWDITGIVFAIVVALVGLVAVARKRSALKRYLAEIDRIMTHHAGDAKARERGLHDLRDRLKHDLLRNRIADGHFVIVEGRLDKLLAGARVETLAQAFDDLPHGLLRTLQDMLADGRMAEEDFLVFDAQLAKTRLTPEAKDDVRQRARAWVAEDAT